MNLRQQKALEIADKSGIVFDGDSWRFPSQSGKQPYRVQLGAEVSCTCDDFILRAKECKHVIAARIARERIGGWESNAIDDVPAKRKTYSQPSWSAYNLHQVNEREHFLELLGDLCQTLPEPQRKPGPGRNPVSRRDSIFAAILKVYSTMSARRNKGYLNKLPCYNSVPNVFGNEDTMPILKTLIERSAAPLREVEKTFAVDSSGFASTKYVRWTIAKHGTEQQQAVQEKVVWVKAHIAIGTKTNIITAADVLEEGSGDMPQFSPLAKQTAATFKIDEMTADKAYCSTEAYQTISDFGGTLYAPFKTNATGAAGGVYERMYHYFCMHRAEFLTHYHARSNLKSTFSAVKRKFGDAVRSKTVLAMKNEVLAKFVAYNITCLIAEMYALGINPIFLPQSTCPRNDGVAQILRFPGV